MTIFDFFFEPGERSSGYSERALLWSNEREASGEETENNWNK